MRSGLSELLGWPASESELWAIWIVQTKNLSKTQGKAHKGLSEDVLDLQNHDLRLKQRKSWINSQKIGCGSLRRGCDRQKLKMLWASYHSKNDQISKFHGKSWIRVLEEEIWIIISWSGRLYVWDSQIQGKSHSEWNLSTILRCRMPLYDHAFGSSRLTLSRYLRLWNQKSRSIGTLSKWRTELRLWHFQSQCRLHSRLVFSELPSPHILSKGWRG